MDVEPPKHNALCEAALRYARQGFQVFPLTPHTKIPLIRGGRSWKDATLDETAILKWWGDTPEANIGIACVEGLVVIDQDLHHADQDGVEAWQTILSEHEPHETLVQVTGSNGLHAVYFDTRHRHTNSKKGTIIEPVRGIDLKGRGYIVAAPSVHPNGRTYKWVNPGTPIAQLPEWFYTEAGPRASGGGIARTSRPCAIREPTELETQAALLIEDVDPCALLGRATLDLIADGDPEEPDQSTVIARICRGAAQVRFDPEKLFGMLRDVSNVGGKGIRRRIEERGEQFGLRYLIRIMLWAHQRRAEVLLQIEAMRVESDEYEWPRVLAFVGRNGTEQKVRGKVAKGVLLAGLDVAQERVCLDPMLGVESQLPSLTGFVPNTIRKAVQALEWSGWWTPSEADGKFSTHAYKYTLNPDREARMNPPQQVRTFRRSGSHSGRPVNNETVGTA
jgi:hypothetical protein